MRNNFAKAFAIGLAAVAVAVVVILFMQRGAHVDLPGTMKIRTIGSAPDETLVIADLHLSNPSDYNFEVRDITVRLETKSGDMSRKIVSKVDAERLFDSMPQAGPFHQALYTGALIPPHSTGDYTIAAPFGLPEQMMKIDIWLVVTIREINGTTVEFSEK